MKRCLAFILSLSVVIAMAGCSVRDKVTGDSGDKASAVSAAVTEVFDALVAQDSEGFFEYCLQSEFSDEAFFDDHVIMNAYGEDMALVAKNVLKTVDADIDDGDISVDGSKAKVSMEITECDLAAILDSADYKDVMDLVADIQADGAPLKTVELKFDMKLKDGSWYVSKPMDILDPVCAWQDIDENSIIESEPVTETTAATEPTETEELIPNEEYASAISEVTWYDCGSIEPDGYEYINAVAVEVDLEISEEGSSLDWNKSYYEIYVDGEYTGSYISSILEDNGKTYVGGILRVIKYKDLANESGYLDSHEIEFRFFNSSKEYICSHNCTTDYIDPHFDGTIEGGDSEALSHVYFIDWYNAYYECLELDIFLKDPDYELVTSYALTDPDGNIIHEDYVSGKGQFAAVIIYPEDCKLDKFEGKYTLDCYDEEENLICSAQVNVDKSYK